MLKINRTSFNINNQARKFVAGLGKGDALLPVILLEIAVTGGRTYHAYRRDGYVEARERFTEESVGAVFWLGGVSAFNKIGDLIGIHLLKLKDVNINEDPKAKKKSRFGFEKVDYDVGEDEFRKPLGNYLNEVKTKAIELEKMGTENLKKMGKKIPVYSEKTIAIFKFTKIIASILLANTVIGFIVPKINQAITRKYQGSLEELNKKKHVGNYSEKNAESTKNSAHKTPVKAQGSKTPDNKNDNQPASQAAQKEAMSDFMKKSKSPNPSFQGAGFVNNLLSLTNNLETDARYKLLSTDVGIAGGRAINARNKYERREVLFRDIGSLYFYLLCRGHVNSALNWLMDGRGSRLDPVMSKELTMQAKKAIRKGSIAPELFEKIVLGDNNAKIPQEILNLFVNNKKVVKIEDIEKVYNDKQILERIRHMSELQPKREGISIISKEQLADVFKGGLVNDVEFLKRAFNIHTGGKATNPMKYVKDQDLRRLKSEMEFYLKNIADKAKKSGKDISIDLLKKADKINFVKNSVNLGIGFGISAYFLSTAIPKIQYWMTRKATGKNSFPGVEKYD